MKRIPNGQCHICKRRVYMAGPTCGDGWTVSYHENDGVECPGSFTSGRPDKEFSVPLRSELENDK
jgi:hypothetical protein